MQSFHDVVGPEFARIVRGCGVAPRRGGTGEDNERWAVELWQVIWEELRGSMCGREKKGENNRSNNIQKKKTVRVLKSGLLALRRRYITKILYLAQIDNIISNIYIKALNMISKANQRISNNQPA
jgi:hypothetical protein